MTYEIDIFEYAKDLKANFFITMEKFINHDNGVIVYLSYELLGNSLIINKDTKTPPDELLTTNIINTSIENINDLNDEDITNNRINKYLIQNLSFFLNKLTFFINYKYSDEQVY